MAGNRWQLDAMIDAINVLGTHCVDRPDVYVSGDLLIQYEEGTPHARVAPDVFVVQNLRARNAELEFGHRLPSDKALGAVLPGGLLPDHEELAAFVRCMRARNAELEGRAPPTEQGLGRDMP